MTLKPMYPAVVNSPGTELAADISADATEITVLSTSGLPPAPNLLTIGSDETAETVRYTKVDGMKLTVERAFQGEAKSWSVGTKVARYFTAYDHDAARENIADLYADRRKAIVLAPGVQDVETDEDSAFRLDEIRGKTEIRDSVGIINVTNPYAIATSGNLLPPFTGASSYHGEGQTPSEPYKATLNATAINMGWSFRVPCLPNTQYTLIVEHNGMIALQDLDKDGNLLNENSGYQEVGELHIKTSANATFVNVIIGNGSKGAGTFTFKNPMLIPGDKPQPFASQSRSMWAAECQLAANPVDGTNSDVLYVGDDGLPYVLEKWGKEALTERQQWGFVATYAGFKQVGGQTYKYPITGHLGLVVKYDGKMLTNFVGIPSSADMGTISQNTGEIHITISNVDSGWGDAYTPTADEIKAYFNGWKMFEWGKDASGTYNGTGTKAWVMRQDDGTYGNGTHTNVPTTQAPINSRWQPYRLQYLKAKPTVEAVKNYETGLTFLKGWNMVEVGRGIVIREKTNPYPNGDGTYSINTLSNPTKYRVDSMSSVFRNNMRDVTYSLERRNPKSEYVGTLGYGFAKTSDYDPNAVYHVTYTMLDSTLVAPISGSIASNLRGAVTDMVSWASDAERRLSVVETKKAEKDSPQWIKPTLMNGVKDVEGLPSVRYMKDAGGFIHIQGCIKPPETVADAFVLPKGYRPSRLLVLSAAGNNSAGSDVMTRFNISERGTVQFIPTNNPGKWVSLDDIPPFLAEQ